MKTIYMLYGKKACELYDISFEKLHSTKHVKFEVAMYKKDDMQKALSKLKKWKHLRQITIVEYGMLLKIIDDEKKYK